MLFALSMQSPPVSQIATESSPDMMKADYLNFRKKKPSAKSSFDYSNTFNEYEGERVRWERIFPSDKNDRFDPSLAILTGPTTDNLVLSIFFMNHSRLFSKEDVFAYLNKHDDNSGIESFFRNKMEFKTSIKIGRNTVGQKIDDLVKSENILKQTVSESEKEKKRHKYRLNLQHPLNIMLRNLVSMIREEGIFKDFKNFEKDRIYTRNKLEIQKLEERELDLDSLDDLIIGYFLDLSEWDNDKEPEFSNLYKKKDTRLVEYCERKNLNWSTINRNWSESIKPKANIKDSSLWFVTKSTLWTICRKLDPTAKEHKHPTKEDMLKLILKKVI
jgi:hypothetical protein